MRSYVLAQPHPYMAVSDEQGRFTFDQVPDGEYRLMAWHPGWQVVTQERNPDNLRILQVGFSEGSRDERPIKVEAGQAVEVEIGLEGAS